MLERFLLCEKHKGKISRGRRLEKQANKQLSVSKTIVDLKTSKPFVPEKILICVKKSDLLNLIPDFVTS